MFYIAGYYDKFDNALDVNIYENFSQAESQIHALIGKGYLDYLTDVLNHDEMKSEILSFIADEIDNFDIDSDRKSFLDVFINDCHYFIREVEENGR